MDPVLSLIEIFDVEFEEVAHDVVKHEETCGFLHRSFVAVVEEVENRSEDLVHALDVLCSRIYFSKNK